METKYIIGQKVYCKDIKSNGLVEKVLKFLNEDESIIYKVRIGKKFVLVSENELELAKEPLSFLKRLLYNA